MVLLKRGEYMIYVVCTNKLEEKDVTIFMEAAIEHAKMSKDVDEGCIAFDISEYNEEDKEIVFFERWENKECLEKHASRCKGLALLDVLNKSRFDKSLKIYEIV